MAQGGQPKPKANPEKIEEFAMDGNGAKKSSSVSPSVVSSVDTDVSTHRTSNIDISWMMLNGDRTNRIIFRKLFVFMKLEVRRWVWPYLLNSKRMSGICVCDV